jgi:hypothetical protein
LKKRGQQERQDDGPRDHRPIVNLARISMSPAAVADVLLAFSPLRERLRVPRRSHAAP